MASNIFQYKNHKKVKKLGGCRDPCSMDRIQSIVSICLKVESYRFYNQTPCKWLNRYKSNHLPDTPPKATDPSFSACGINATNSKHFGSFLSDE